MKILWSARDWAAEIADLPVVGPLPRRTVIVPSEAVAHSLRRLLAVEWPGTLAGTRFVRAARLAEEALEDAGVRFRGSEDGLRAARLEALFADDLPLTWFPLPRLRGAPGWGRAFARTIGDLEAAGLRPEDLPADQPWRDVATIWRALDARAGDSWTTARVLLEAASRRPTAPCVLAAVTGHESAAEVRFVRALPGVTLALHGARPVRDRWLARVEALYGISGEARPAARVGAGQLDRLASQLFQGTADGVADGTVEQSRYAGIETELDATAEWVAREILEHGTPLEDIAVVTPARGVLGALVAARLERLGWPDGGLIPVVVDGGRPLADCAAGARALAVVRTLEAHLAVGALAALLPQLRGGPRRGDALALAFSLGTAGGNAARPEGALDWLAASLPNSGRSPADQERLDRLRPLHDAVRPAIAALVGLARAVLEGASLATLAPAVVDFLDEHVACAPSAALLAAALAPALADAHVASVRGEAAVRLLGDALAGLALPSGRAGDAAVTVAPLEAVVGRPFRAVRIIGLSEGAVPSPEQEDPVLPDLLRAQLGPEMPLAADRALAQLQAIDRIVRDTGARLALSAPRLGLERSDREPSSLFADVAHALGVTPALSSKPNVASRMTPVVVPPVGAMDGLLEASLPVPGLTAERPISASRLQTLLSCPHRFAFETVLGWREPATAPSLRTLAPTDFGSMLHESAEAFYRAHGAEFCARTGTLADWRARAQAIGDGCLAARLAVTPLAGDAVRQQQRDRLRREVGHLIDHDWNDGVPRTYVDVERRFGEAKAGLPIDVGGATLYLHGAIDRIDVQGGRTLVRDLKTGRAHPRAGKEQDPDPVRDVQIAVYGLVAADRARAWGLPGEVSVAYVYTGAGERNERAFPDFEQDLGGVARGWLRLAAGLLEARHFPRTPRAEDCSYCPFRPVCGTGAPERAAAVLAEATGPLAAFRELKAPVEP